MKKRRFFAGIMDRMFVIALFVGFVFIHSGMFGSAGLLGTYQSLALYTSPGTYEYMNYSQYSSSNDSVDPYFTQESNKAAEKLGITSYQEVDNVMTSIFVAANLFYFLITGIFMKASLGEMLCDFKTFDCAGNKADISSMFLRVIAIGVIMGAFIGLRYLLDSTYFMISLLLLVVNWGLIFFKGKSLVDILSFSYIEKV